MSDDPRVRAAFGYRLRAHVNYQDGRNSKSPSIVFADYDYEVGDGKCGLHEDGKSANEPAIVYARADALIDAIARIEQQAAEIARLRAQRDEWRSDFSALEKAIVGDTGLSAIIVAAQARKFKPMYDDALAEITRLRAQLEDRVHDC